MGEKAFTKILDLYGLDRLRMRIVTESGKVTYTVVQYETFVQDEWLRSFDTTTAMDTPIVMSSIQTERKTSSRYASRT